MVGCNHRFNGHELEQSLGDSEGQGGLACCHPWGLRESDMTERVNNSNKRLKIKISKSLADGRDTQSCYWTNLWIEKRSLSLD